MLYFRTKKKSKRCCIKQQTQAWSRHGVWRDSATISVLLIFMASHSCDVVTCDEQLNAPIVLELKERHRHIGIHEALILDRKFMWQRQPARPTSNLPYLNAPASLRFNFQTIIFSTILFCYVYANLREKHTFFIYLACSYVADCTIR